MNIKERIEGDFILIHKVFDSWIHKDDIREVYISGEDDDEIQILKTNGEKDSTDFKNGRQLVRLISLGKKLKTWQEDT